MDAKRILAELQAERTRIDRAIAAIQGITSDGARRSTTAAAKPRRRSRMSAAGRRRLSMLLKRRWAQGKMGKRRANTQPHARTVAPKPRASNKASKKKGGISAAGRKRLSEMMKKRWAARKKAKAASA